MTDQWVPDGGGYRWTGGGAGPSLDDYGTRYTKPDFDETGENGPRSLYETTGETQVRYLGGPANAGLPGFLVMPGGVWYASDDGREWRRVDEEGQGS